MPLKAGLQPGVILFLTYSTTHRRGSTRLLRVRVGRFLVLKIFDHAYIMDGFGGTGLKSWQWLFIIEGIPVIAGIAAYSY